MSEGQALYQEFLRSELERGYTIQEADQHFGEAVQDATEALWEEVN